MDRAVQFILRWLVRILAGLLFITGVTNIPTFIANQIQFFQSLGGETTIRILAVVLATLLGLVAVGPNRIETTARWISTRWPGQSKDEQLRARCRELSDEIYEYLADRKRDDRSRQLWFEGTGAESEEERHQNWVKSSIELERYSTETMARYAQRFEARSLALFDAAERRGWVDPEERSNFEHPTNPIGIQEVAQRLGAIGHSL